ncbi:hypothetical protein SBRCBS47491_000642 [Sporothrix bragantina]|uniref:C6 zinc finger domain containing protein n=1 Tax=Sporothrix bragantina TaxID=671064 RepID=A0ABP0AS21_9PEZI
MSTRTSETVHRRSTSTPPAELTTRLSADLLVHRLAFLPELGDIDHDDRLALRCYFQNHLRRVGLGEEFVNDGNRKVVTLLQQYPEILGDVVVAIGHTLVARSSGTSVVPALTRKSRALARLRNSQTTNMDIEPQLLLILCIGALELIDMSFIPPISAIPVLLSCASHAVAAHIATSTPLSPTAKYFLRALARQDILLGLMYRRKNMLLTSLWFDSSYDGDIDRFLGLTMSLMPLLEELCGLAEKMKTVRNAKESDEVLQEPLQNLYCRISAWHPSMHKRPSFLDTRKYLCQAHAFRAAALLYLHRLCHPPGSCHDADSAAVNLAYDVLLFCYDSPGAPDSLHADVRMLHWPLFVTGCEMKTDVDRQLVLDLLRQNHHQRGTYTPLKTIDFLVEHLWPVVDAGSGNVNWMDLVEQFSSDFAPL